jgi:hypothetical protein
MLADVNAICGQIALALQNSELQIYGMIALLALLSAFLFPPRNDPDQI